MNLVCFTHWRQLAAKLGFCSVDNSKDLTAVLTKVFDKELSTGYTELKINPKTCELFKLSYRPQGSAKRRKNNILPVENRSNHDCGCSEDVKRKWKTRFNNCGSVNWDKAASLLQ